MVFKCKRFKTLSPIKWDRNDQWDDNEHLHVPYKSALILFVREL